MDQKKTGLFLKELRKEKNLTQEQLAEKFNISSRTVSRWETGTNLPDLSILVEIADFYEIDIREIIDGERKISYHNEFYTCSNHRYSCCEHSLLNRKAGSSSELDEELLPQKLNYIRKPLALIKKLGAFIHAIQITAFPEV